VERIYTPTYASWFECFFRKFVFEGSNDSSHDDLAKAIQANIRWRNKNKHHKAILKEQNKIKVA